jgi:hypothetical protein
MNLTAAAVAMLTMLLRIVVLVPATLEPKAVIDQQRHCWLTSQGTQ